MPLGRHDQTAGSAALFSKMKAARTSQYRVAIHRESSYAERIKMAAAGPEDRLKQPLFHGTSALAAVCISVDGFRLLNNILRRFGNGSLGNGIYVTASLEQAAWYSRGYIFEVRLAPGTRILWLDGHYDPRVIDSLRREFGKELLTGSARQGHPVEQTSPTDGIDSSGELSLESGKGRTKAAGLARPQKRIAESGGTLSALLGEVPLLRPRLPGIRRGCRRLQSVAVTR